MTTAPGWLVVNADDFGVSRGTTLGIIKAHREGIVTSASICVTTNHFEFAVEQAKQCPELGIGLHFTLSSGLAVADPRRVPLLVDSGRWLNKRFTTVLFVRKTVVKLLWQIEEELEAQLNRLEQAGIRPDHINGERHVHLSPAIFDVVVEVAHRRGIPFVRAGRDVGPGLLRARDIPALAANGGVIKWALLSDLAKRARSRLDGIRSADHFGSFMFTGRTATFLPRLLASPVYPGVTEVMVHPALPEEDGELQLGNWELQRYVKSPDRRAELDACLNARGNTGAWRLTTFGELATRGAT